MYETTIEYRKFTGEIGKLSVGSEKLPVASSISKECTLCEVTIKKDLNTDKLYLMEISEAINADIAAEVYRKETLEMLTITSRILRLYVALRNPSEALITLTMFIVI